MDLYQEFARLIEQLIIEGRTKEALEFSKQKFGSLSNDINNTIVLNLARINEVQNKTAAQLISAADANVQTAQIAQNALYLVQNRIPQTIQTNKLLGSLGSTAFYELENKEALEKIIGSKNNLLKINWLEKGLKAAKSVCQVVRSDGEKGTGFMIKDGYLITNYHVLPNKDKTAGTKIIFDYEEDIMGAVRKTTEFRLEPDTFIGSPIDKLDYACIKVAGAGVTEWGYVELERAEPGIDDNVVIIQHALGETKQIALTANTIIGKYNNRIYYTTDTQKGSSGSPVFNADWKVVALHHAGKTLEEGGYVVEEGGSKVAANEGIPIKDVLDDIQERRNK